MIGRFNAIESAPSIAKPLWLRVLPYVVVVCVVGGSLYAAYEHGCTTTAARDKITADALLLKHNAEIISWQGRVTVAEHKAADDLAAIDAEHQKDIANEKSKTAAVLADYRAGIVRLRDKFSPRSIAAIGVPSASTGTGSGDAAAPIGLQDADVNFLVSDIADQADQVADQLRACQAVVKADRAVRVVK